MRLIAPAEVEEAAHADSGLAVPLAERRWVTREVHEATLWDVAQRDEYDHDGERYVQEERRPPTHGAEARVQGAKAWPERITPSSHGGIPMFATGHSFHASPVNCPADSCLAFLRFSQCSSPLLIDALHELQQYLSGSGAAARIPSYIGAPSRPPADSLLLLDATGGLAVPWVLGGAGVEGELSQGHDHQTTPPRSRFQ